MSCSVDALKGRRVTERLSNDVFISYRRDASQYMAMALWQDLTARGIDVFYDIENIAAGDFEQIILTQIAARPYLIPVLVPGALARCEEPEDWLRRELEQGIATGRVLVPVCTPEFDPDDIDRYLPSDTAGALRRFNMLEIPSRYFKYAVADLAEKYLLPIRLESTAAPAVAIEAARRHAVVSEAAPPVTADTLTAERLFNTAVDKHTNTDFAGAVAEYGKAIQLKPDFAEAFNERAISRWELGDEHGAIADLDEAIRIDPHNARAFVDRGYFREALGDVEGSEADFQRADELSEGD